MRVAARGWNDAETVPGVKPGMKDWGG